MPTFAYQARDSRGAQVEGTRDATDQNSALLALREAGLFVTRLAPVAAKSASAKSAETAREKAKNEYSNTNVSANLNANERAASRAMEGQDVTIDKAAPTKIPVSRNDLWAFANTKELSLFFRQMHAMINAGSSVARSLQVYGENASNKSLERAALQMRREIAEGRTFSDTMRAFPGLFSVLMINMIAAGERGGFLDTMCERLADYCERDHDLQQSVKREMLYPKIQAVCAFLIPSVVTLVLAGFQPWLKQIIPPIIIFALAYALYRVLSRLMRLYGRAGMPRLVLDSLKLMIPVSGKVVRSLATAKFSRALAAMYAAGVGAEASMRIAGESCGNAAIEKRVIEVASELNQGGGFTKTLAKTRQFPPIAMQMLAAGEESGAIDTQLEKVAQFLEIEAETAIRQGVKILGVLMFLLVAIYIGSIVIGFYTGYGVEIEKYIAE